MNIDVSSKEGASLKICAMLTFYITQASLKFCAMLTFFITQASSTCL